MSETKVRWVIERYIFEDEAELALIAEVKRQGGKVKVLDPLDKDPLLLDLEDIYPYAEPTVFRGSLNLGTKVFNETSWIPGTIYNKKNFECTSYYVHWGQHMLNSVYWLYPLAELNTDRIKENIELYWDSYKYDFEFFIRPNSGSKPFAGGVFPIKDLSALKDVDPSTLVLIAPWKEIEAEYRFVVAGSEVITGCQYFQNIPPEIKGYVDLPAPVEVTEYLKRILTTIQNPPDSIYTVDVCLSEGKYYILELNSFSCSNLYSCDLAKVVSAVNEVAIKEFNEVYS